MPEVPQAIRHEAAILARRKAAREAKFSREAPCHWSPGTVKVPNADNMFTSDGAWEFIADKLEDDSQSASYVPLENPPGQRAIVMIVPNEDQHIYIKFQLKSGKIIGRSFHNSIH